MQFLFHRCTYENIKGNYFYKCVKCMYNAIRSLNILTLKMASTNWTQSALPTNIIEPDDIAGYLISLFNGQYNAGKHVGNI